MNYQKIYESIIEQAKLEKRKRGNTYYENHHILPKCLKGTNDKENLVLLTAKEHFICHKLLTYIYPENRDLATAFHFMVYGKNDYKNTSRDYEYARKLISKNGLSEETKQKIRGRKHTKEEKEKISKALKGKNKSQQHRNSIRDANLGMKRPEWVKEKMRNSRKKLLVGGYKIIILEETKKKISKANSGKNNGMYGKKAANAIKIKIDGVYYDSIKEAEKKLKMKSYQIYYRLNSPKYKMYEKMV